MQATEFEIIKKFIKKLPAIMPGVIEGPGDDAAVLKLAEDYYLLVTTDSQVEGVHFLSKLSTPKDIGRKSVAVNISDIAAMGGVPTYCLVSLILPKTLDEAYTDQLYDGIIEECKKYNIQIIGGNISSGRELIIDIFMLGKTTPNKLLLRRGAKAGDKILVTGSLGESACGLQLLLNPKLELKNEYKKMFLSRQFTPTPRLKESQIIAELRLATSMIDISDGLGADLNHICENSKVGAKIYEEKLPVKDAVSQIAKKTGGEEWELGLNGGEDYELIFTAPESAVNTIISAIKKESGTDVGVIGDIVPKKEGKWFVLRNGKTIKLPEKGWSHF